MRPSLWLGLVAAMFVATPAWPQASSSTVRGSVMDQTQSAIPAATITMTNSATNLTRETQSNAAGLYVFPGVIPGPYRIVAQYPGLQTFEGTLTVQLQQDVTIPIVMQVATEVTTVDVVDVTPLVRVDSPTLGHVLERQRTVRITVRRRVGR